MVIRGDLNKLMVMSMINAAKKMSFIAMLAGSMLSMSSAQAEPDQGKYNLDSAHTSVTFVVNHMGYSDLVGTFNETSGTLAVAKDGSSKGTVVISSASIDTNHQKRDDHLRSPDFFNAKQFPNIVFTFSDDDKLSAKERTLVGELELHGVKKEISLQVTPKKAATDPWGMYRIGYKALATIKRSDFDMNFMQGSVGDEIELHINVEAVKEQ